MMKRALLIILILIVIGAGASFVVLPSIVETRVTTTLAALGFPAPDIGQTSLSLSGAQMQDIRLDKDGFSTIETLDINFSWPVYLLSQQIDSLHISKIVHSDLSDEINLNVLLDQLSLDRIRDLPVQSLSIDLGQLNLSTDFGDIRTEAKILISTLKNGSKTIQAVAWAKQFQLGFQIPISGLIQEDGSFLFESTFNDGKLNVGPMRVSRMSGWASLEDKNGAERGAAFSTQLDAGSADILGVPMQDLSIALSQSPHNSNGIFRAGLSGMPSIHISGDWNQDKENIASNITVEFGKGEDTKALIKHLLPEFDTDNIRKLTDQPLLLTLQYLPERRFAGGPVPFDITVTAPDADNGLLSGNILIYPDTMDVKGSVFGNDEAVSDVMTLVSGKAQDLEDKTVRIDFNLKSWLQKLMQDNQG